jgi:hypothetical protein
MFCKFVCYYAAKFFMYNDKKKMFPAFDVFGIWEVDQKPRIMKL